jgi:hypothetical protein
VEAYPWPSSAWADPPYVRGGVLSVTDLPPAFGAVDLEGVAVDHDPVVVSEL